MTTSPMAPVNPRTTVEHIDASVLASCYMLPVSTVSLTVIDYVDALMLALSSLRTEHPAVESSECEQLSGVVSTGVADSGTTVTSDQGATGESESILQASTCTRTPGNGCA